MRTHPLSRFNPLRRIGTFLSMALGLAQAQEAKRTNATTVPPKQDLDPPPTPSSGMGGFVNNHVTKVQTIGKGYDQRWYRLLVKNGKAAGLRRCNANGDFINRNRMPKHADKLWLAA